MKKKMQARFFIFVLRRSTKIILTEVFGPPKSLKCDDRHPQCARQALGTRHISPSFVAYCARAAAEEPHAGPTRIRNLLSHAPDRPALRAYFCIVAENLHLGPPPPERRHGLKSLCRGLWSAAPFAFAGGCHSPDEDDCGSSPADSTGARAVYNPSQCPRARML